MSRTNLIRTLFAILAIGFFATPIAARVLGVTAQSFENRRLADPPKLSQGWDAFNQTTRYLTDRMPLRKQAIEANTHIWTDVFDTDPNYAGRQALARDQALPFAGRIEDERSGRSGPGLESGRGKWLFLDDEFEIACDDSVTDIGALERWGDLVRAVRDAGHPAFMFVAPAKASVYPEHLPATYAFDHCAPEGRKRFWDVMGRAGAAQGVIGLRSDLLKLKRSASDEVFQRQDSHWSTLGAITLVERALETLGGGVRLRRSEIVGRREVFYTGDISRIGGRSETDTRIEYDLVRAPGAPRVPGRTLLVCDSFAYRWIRLFKPYFENVRYVSLRRPEAEIAAEIAKADTVILEANELLMKVQGAPGEQAAKILAALRVGRG